MTWQLIVARSAQKSLARFPSRDRERILAALEQLCLDPLAGDIVQLKHPLGGFRKRVGAYRIFFDIVAARNRVEVSGIERRGTTTYRRR